MSQGEGSFQFEESSTVPSFGVVEIGEEEVAEQGSVTGGVLIADQNPDEDGFDFDNDETAEEGSVNHGFSATTTTGSSVAVNQGFSGGTNMFGNTQPQFSLQQQQQQQQQQQSFGFSGGLGQGGAFRHRRPLKDSIQGITKNALQQFCKRAGVSNTSGMVYEELRMLIKSFLESVIRNTITYTEHGRRKTVIEGDVYNGLRYIDYKEFRVDRSVPQEFVQSENLNDALSKPSVIRMARRGGVLSQSADVYDEVRVAMYEFLKKNIRDAISITSSQGRKVLTSKDVVTALENNGLTLYGFGYC